MPTSATRSTVSYSWPTSTRLALLNLDTRSTANMETAGQLPRSLSLVLSMSQQTLGQPLNKKQAVPIYIYIYIHVHMGKHTLIRKI